MAMMMVMMMVVVMMMMVNKIFNTHASFLRP
jgi:hypothetical protein